MELKLKKKNVIILTIVFAFLVGMFSLILNVTNGLRKNDNTVENKGHMISINAGSYGNWETSIYFDAWSDYITFSNDQKSLEYNAPTLYDMMEQTSYVISIYLEENSVQQTIPKNSIKISLPKYIFALNEGTNPYIEKYTDAYDGGIDFKNEDVDIYSQVFTEFPYCDVDCNEELDRLFYWTFDESTDEFYISNSQAIQPNNGSIDEQYSLRYDSNLASVVANEEYSFQPTINIGGNEYSYDKLTTKVVYSGGSQTGDVSVENLEGNISGEYDTWQTDLWGDNPSADADLYLAYTISGPVNYTGSGYDMFIRTDYTDGSLVAYSKDGWNYEIGSLMDYNSSSNSCYYTTDNYITCTLVFAYYYNNQSSIDVNIDITASASVEGGNLNEKSFSYSSTYTNDPGQDEPVYPTGTSLNTSLTTVNDDDGVGGINSINKGEDVNVSFRLASGLDNISSGNGQNINAFNLWDVTENGSTNYTLSMSTDGMYFDDTYNSLGNITSLGNGDYEITSFSLIDDIEYNYALNSNKKYYLTETNDNTATKNVYAKINGQFTKIGTYYRSGNDYYFDSSYTGVSSSTSSDYKFKVTLPSGVTDIKVEYTGNRAAVYMGIVVDAKVKSTNNVKNIIGDNSSIILKEKYITSSSRVEESASGYQGTYLTKLDTFSGANSSSQLIGRENGNDSITYIDNFYEGISFNNVSKAKAFSLLNKQNNAVVYEVLPKGAVLDGDVTCKTYHSNNNCNVTVAETKTDYVANRTMIKLNVSYNNNYYENSNKYESGFTINFKILYSSDSNAQFGQTLYKDVAYVSGSMLSEGYSSSLDADSSLFSSSDIRTKFNSISGDYQLFATNSIEVQQSIPDSGTVTKKVKNLYNNSSYGNNTSVVVSHKYKYKLEYSFKSDYEEITNMKFVDIIENNYGNKEHFNGYFDSVDVSALRSMGINPTIYYATDLSLIDVNNIDVHNTSIWTTLKPNNVVAVVVDCGNTVIKASDSEAPYVEIVMNAVNENSTKKSYNKGFVIFDQVGGSSDKKIESNGTEVSLIADTINYSLTGTGGSGSSSNPVLLDNNFEYNITLSNSSNTYEYDNIVFEFNVPQGLSVGTITGISSSNYSINGSVITFNVSKLSASQTINITIPVNIVVGNNANYTYNAESKITKLNNRDYSGTVMKTYHQVKLPTLTFDKKLKTSNSGNQYVDGTALVAAGEKYSYQVSVKNTSTATARNLYVEDTVPNGVTVDTSSISNDGTYQNGKIKWNISTLNAGSTVKLTYEVTLGDVALGTRLSSSALVQLKNPFDSSTYLYDETTNVVTAYYQVASDVKVTNKINGALADSNKLFTYTFEFNGTEDNAGSYDVLNKAGSKIGTLSINGEGKGTYTANLKANESVTFKLLTSGISYSAKLKIEEGYTVSASVDGSEVSGNYVITGTTDETNDNYEFTNSYSVSTTQTIEAKVTYDKEMTAGMFKVGMGDEEKSIDANGNVTFDQITYDNVAGQFKYTIKQINTGVKKVKYDTTQYTVTVNVINDGKGHLTASVKYYDSNNKEVSSATFNNKYIPSGFMVVSDNTSDYIDRSKTFNYTLDFNSSDGLNGSYVVKDNNSKELENLVFENGVAHYEFSMGSDETILFVDLPNGINYTISQELVPYYTTTVRKMNLEDANDFVLDTTLNDKEEHGTVGDTGVTSDDTTVITFDNNYKTTAEYHVTSKVALIDKQLEDGEFLFKITDISSGSTKGYTETVKNNKDGEISFTTINYKVPGTYKYEIRQVKGTSNHIYYDTEKIVLTLVLTDNGDGTMRVLDTYEFFGEAEYFVNKYSKDPIVPEVPDDMVNPNTLDRSILVVGLLIIVVLLMIIEGRVKIRGYKLRS